MTIVAVAAGRIFVARSGPFGPSDIDPDDIRDAACDATASSQVCNPPTTTPPDPLPESSDVGDPAAGAGLFGQLLVALLVIALIVGVAWLIARWRDGSESSDDGDDLDDGDTDESVDEEVDARIIDHETPPERWRRMAVEHREAGRYRESVRCEYRALVGDLARAGFVDEIPGRTSGEEREQVAEIAPGISAAFGVAADTFDVAWFDDGAVIRADDDRFLEAQRSVLDAVGSRR